MGRARFEGAAVSTCRAWLGVTASRHCHVGAHGGRALRWRTDIHHFLSCRHRGGSRWGLWPGFFATVLSALAAWYLGIPQLVVKPDVREVVEFLLVLFICGVNVSIAVVLHKLIERLIIRQRNIGVLLESAPNGFVLVDGNGVIRLVNASAEKLFGYKRDELVGRAVESLVPEHYRSEHSNVRAAYQEKPEERPMGLGRDLSGRRKDGSEFPAEIGLSPIEQEGRPAVLAAVVDISARTRAEQSQRLMIGELKHRTANLLTIMQAIISNTLKAFRQKAIRPASDPGQPCHIRFGTLQVHVSHRLSSTAAA